MLLNDVFYELLEEWHGLAESEIYENSSNIGEELDELEKKKEKYECRIREAVALESIEYINQLKRVRKIVNE